MTKKEMVIYEFDDEDFELLEKPLPDSPCDRCCFENVSACSGCMNYSYYKSKIQKYKDKEILVFAQLLKERNELIRQIHSTQNKIDKVDQKLPQEIMVRLGLL